jgi:hypothetical protein
MLKNIVQITEVINEKEYSMLCGNDSPTNDIKEFCYRLLKFVGQIEDQVKAQQELEKSVQETAPEAVQEEKPQE